MCAMAGLLLCACQWFSVQKEESPKPPEQKASSVQPPQEAPDRADNTIEAIKKRGELRVGMQVGYIPFEMLGSDGTLEGFDVDLARLVARNLMVNLRIVRLNWQELMPALDSGEIDVIMSGMNVTPERNVNVLFTIPVIESGRMFVVHKSNADRYGKFASLNQTGTFVVSAPGGLGEIRPGVLLPKASHREFPSRKAALEEVLNQRAHAFIDGEFSIRLAAAMHPESLVTNFKTITYEPIAWAVRPGDTHWLNWLNNFVRLIRRDGRLDDIKKKWFQDYFLDIKGGSTPPS